MRPQRQELSNLLGMLYDAASDATLWAPFIERLGKHTKSTSAALVVQAYDRALYSMSNSWLVPDESLRAYGEHYGTLDIWKQPLLPKLSGYACTSESLCPRPEMNKTEFYNDFLLEAGIEHGMFALVENSTPCMAAVCLYRDKSGVEFGENELKVVRFLAPHLRRAFKLHFQMSEAKAYSAGAEATLDMLPTGLVLLGHKGEIIFMNKCAAGMITEKDGLLVVGNRLRASRSTESESLAAMVKGATSLSTSKGVSAGGTVLISRRTRPPLQVAISPIRSTGLQAFQTVAVVAFVSDPFRSNRPPEAVLRKLYGLTPAECRVALLFSDGHAPRTIAEMIGVTENTLRSQIKSIYGKIGVKRQCELTRLLLNYASFNSTSG